MPDKEAMLNAHVQFELRRLDTEHLSETVTAEVTALFTWFESVRLADVVTAAWIADLLLGGIHRARADTRLPGLVASAARSGHRAASNDPNRLEQLVLREDYDRIAKAIIGMKGVRQAITTQFTTNEVYSRLLSHVLYQGIKNYIQSESVIARRVPGASALMKMGQSALSTAAPSLEKTIDRQLTAFVNANIQDSIRESRHYLDRVLDDETLETVAEQIWDANADSTAADVAGLVSEDSLVELAESGVDALSHLISTPSFRDMLVAIADDFLSRSGSRTIADLLADLGITPPVVADQLTRVLGPIMAAATDHGLPERMIRGHLEPFYDEYFAGGSSSA